MPYIYASVVILAGTHLTNMYVDRSDAIRTLGAKDTEYCNAPVYVLMCFHHTKTATMERLVSWLFSTQRSERSERKRNETFDIWPRGPVTQAKVRVRMHLRPHLGQEVDGQVVVRVPEDALLHQEHGAPGLLDLRQHKSNDNQPRGVGEGWRGISSGQDMPCHAMPWPRQHRTQVQYAQ